MTHYRIYLLNLQNHIREREEFFAPDDVAALEAVQKYKSEGGVEVWDSTRLVARIGTDGKAAP